MLRFVPIRTRLGVARRCDTQAAGWGFRTNKGIVSGFAIRSTPGVLRDEDVGYRKSARLAVGDGTIGLVFDPAIGVRIAQWRRRRGLSQVALAGLVGPVRVVLSQVERGLRGVDSRPPTAASSPTRSSQACPWQRPQAGEW